MECVPSRHLSCKACLYSTSHLLEFLIHVRKVHFERHASKSDGSSSRGVEEELSPAIEHFHDQSPINSPVSDSHPPENLRIDANDNATKKRKLAKASSDANDSMMNETQRGQRIFVKQELLEEQLSKYSMEMTDADSKPNEKAFAFLSDNGSKNMAMFKADDDALQNKNLMEKEVLGAANREDFEKTCAMAPTSANHNLASSTPFRGNKINDIANNLKGGNSKGARSWSCMKQRSLSQNSFVPTAPSVSNSSEVSATKDFIPSFCRSQEQGNNSIVSQRRNSLPSLSHKPPPLDQSLNSCNGAMFRPFAESDRLIFPNHSHETSASSQGLYSHSAFLSSPHNLHIKRSEQPPSSSATPLYNSAGSLMKSFHALMCAGFVTMPQNQVLETINCSKKRWEYVQQTLHDAFRKFPYLTAPEVQILSNLTELSCQQVKTLFVVARLQHGISWDQDEIENARNFLRIPKNRFSGE